MDRSLLSIVIPIFNEEEVLPELVRRLEQELPELGFDEVEIVFIDDGSQDRTRDEVTRLAERPRTSGARTPQVRYRGVFLTRNFGHQAAVSVGLEQAAGSVVCVMDGDLQDPPEVIRDLLQALDGCSGGNENGEADVAYAVRRRRKENVIKRLAYDLFYRLLQGVSNIEIPRDSGDFCCMRRPVVDAMLSLPERNRFIRGLRAWVGFRQVGVEYERSARSVGRTKYSLRKLLALAYDGLFSFSSLPVKLMQFVGFAVSTLALLVAGFYFVWYFIATERFPQGWATQIVSTWFLGGVQMLFLGLLGEYVFRTFDESRRRPPALVARVVGERRSSQQPDRCETNPR